MKGLFNNYLLVSDMDGTLLRDDKTISTENIEALEYFVKQGGRFTMSTGRAPQAVRQYLPQLPINAPAIVVNGAVIYDYKQEHALLEIGMPENSRALVEDVAKQYPQIGIEIFLLGKSYVCQMGTDTERHFKTLKIPYQLRPVSEIEPPEQWRKLNLTGEPDCIQSIRDMLNETATGYTVTTSTPYFCEITGPMADKGSALMRLSKHLGAETICAAGDGFNDLTMLRVANFSFAPENGLPEVKETANYTVSSNQQDMMRDVVRILEKIK